MKQELQPLLIELCFIAITRNEINTRRHRARFRKNYYAHAVRVVEAHNNSNYDLRMLNRDLVTQTKYKSPDVVKTQARIAAIEDSMLYLRDKHPKPKKWQTMGLHKLRSLVLQGEGEYAIAKHETMEFSIKYRERVRQITTKLKCSLYYDNGAVANIVFKDNVGNIGNIGLEKMQQYAVQYELNKAVDGMLR